MSLETITDPRTRLMHTDFTNYSPRMYADINPIQPHYPSPHLDAMAFAGPPPPVPDTLDASMTMQSLPPVMAWVYMLQNLRMQHFDAPIEGVDPMEISGIHHHPDQGMIWERKQVHPMQMNAFASQQQSFVLMGDQMHVAMTPPLMEPTPAQTPLLQHWLPPNRKESAPFNPYTRIFHPVHTASEVSASSFCEELLHRVRFDTAASYAVDASCFSGWSESNRGTPPLSQDGEVASPEMDVGLSFDCWESCRCFEHERIDGCGVVGDARLDPVETLVMSMVNVMEQGDINDEIGLLELERDEDRLSIGQEVAVCGRETTCFSDNSAMPLPDQPISSSDAGTSPAPEVIKRTSLRFRKRPDPIITPTTTYNQPESSPSPAPSSRKPRKNMSRSRRSKPHATTLSGAGLKPFVCELEGCGKRFLRKHDMRRHLRSHDGPKITCDICLKTFARRDGLIRHMRRNEMCRMGNRDY
ncbi:hypothetical protein HDU97_010204 [Phlyctochytrium planicorne]|nr:hypothetical protein HDU97_010204 [Phlyctochytrium planicorne]